MGCRKITHSYGAKDVFKSKSKKYTILEPFFELQIKGKIACHCGTKRIYKSKFTKHIILGPLFEVGMSKNSTPLWRKIKIYKIYHSRAIFGKWDVEKLHAIVAESALASQNAQKTSVLNIFRGFDVEKVSDKKNK